MLRTGDGSFLLSVGAVLINMLHIYTMMGYLIIENCGIGSEPRRHCGVRPIKITSRQDSIGNRINKHYYWNVYIHQMEIFILEYHSPLLG